MHSISKSTNLSVPQSTNLPADGYYKKPKLGDMLCQPHNVLSQSTPFYQSVSLVAYCSRCLFTTRQMVYLVCLSQTPHQHPTLPFACFFITGLALMPRCFY